MKPQIVADKRAASPNPVAQAEAELGGKLQQLRKDHAANATERTRLLERRAVLVAHKADVELERRKRMIEQGRGITGATQRRKESDSDLAEVENEIQAVDAAISFEDERSQTLSTELEKLEKVIAEARLKHNQQQLAAAVMAKKEEFISSFLAGCVQLGEMVQLAEKLMSIDGQQLLNEALEDLYMRTNRLLMIDRLKYTEPQSAMAIARRSFEVTALLPPSESEAKTAQA